MFHKFWSTQLQDNSPIKKDIRLKPLTLPDNFAWCEIDWDKDSDTTEAYELLQNNYVEDDDAMLRFDYSKEHLKWILTVPGWNLTLQLGVRAKNKLVAMITGTIANISVSETIVPMIEINFLCIHKKLRSLRLTPVLIKEITRRSNLLNIQQSIYTIGKELPMSIAKTNYWIRSLNSKKLVEIGFSSKERQTPLPEIVIPGWRPMQEEDIPQVVELLSSYLRNFEIRSNFTQEDIHHWMTGQFKIVYCFVIVNSNGKITDFASYYYLPSTILNHPKHRVLHAAYSFYNVPGSVTIKQLFQSLLIEAKRLDFDVFYALDIMENSKCFDSNSGFNMGSGNLYYYLYNYSIMKILSSNIGVVLM